MDWDKEDKIKENNRLLKAVEKVFVEYNDDFTVISDDGEKLGWREDKYDFTPLNLHLTSKDKFFDHLEHVDVSFVPVVGKKYYLIYVIYSTGSTFGRTDGVHSFIDIVENEEDANRIKKIVDKNTDKDSGWYVKVPHSIKTVWGGYCGSWKGYFETFDSCNVVEFTLLK